MCMTYIATNLAEMQLAYDSVMCSIYNHSYAYNSVHMHVQYVRGLRTPVPSLMELYHFYRREHSGLISYVAMRDLIVP